MFAKAYDEIVSFCGMADPAPPPRPKLTLHWRGKTEPVPDIVFLDVTAPSKPPDMPRLEVLALADRIGPWVQQTPLGLCLNYWSDWMRCDDRDLGAKSQSGIRGGEDDEHEGFDTSAASDAAVARISREVAMATDAMIDSLPRHYTAAIYRRCGVSSIWRFPNLDFVAVLPEAEAELTEKLKRNVATRAFF